MPACLLFSSPNRFSALLCALLLSATGTSFGETKYLLKAEELRHAERWRQISEALFPGREIEPAGDRLVLTAPVVPKDPAMVPVKIQSHFEQSDTAYVRSITLLIDHNPAPLAAVFHFTPRSGEAHLKTRVRVNEFSDITAVAETSDGRLYHAKKFVRASGGCDVAPRVDTQALASSLGEMKLSLPGGARLGQASPADLSILHPNYNGMQTGNTAGTYLPPRLVQKVEIAFADEPLLTIDGHMSLSENPRFRFYYQPDREGSFSVNVLDSDDTRFEQTWSVDVIDPSSSGSGA